MKLVISGNKLEHDYFANDITIEKFNGNFGTIGLVIYPTYTEHQPKLVLKAISKGIPVITTTACGISSSEKVMVINIGNYERLKAALLTHQKVIKSSFKIRQ